MAYGDGLERKMLPWPLRSIPWLRDLVAYGARRWMSYKYSEDAVLASKQRCEECLSQLAERVSALKTEGGPLLGGASYSCADLAIAVALEAFRPEAEGGVTITALTPNLVSKLLAPMLEEHPVLGPWKNAVLRSLPDDVKELASLPVFIDS
mmetsp:Transcript_21011/g.58260  ORF Transcript_21011/g.58260 Transcript_21011/m.58260 type:complete len:151 (+) Transcript_21011:211-663(+)